MSRPRVLLTVGDPAGVGPEIVVKALSELSVAKDADFLVLGPPRSMAATVEALAARRGLDATPRFVTLAPTPARREDYPAPASPPRPGLPAWAVAEAAALAMAWADWRRAEAADPVPADGPRVALAYPARWLELSCPSGAWSGASGAASADAVALAVALCRQPDDPADALVTGPIAKAAWAAAGRPYPGHTEYLGLLAEAPGKEVMLLAGGGLRVALLTVHEALRRVPELVTEERIVALGRTVARALSRDFALPRAPRLAVLGLNPHAGEEGRLGDEEITVIAPAVARLRQEGLDVAGPLPADSSFYRMLRGEFDAILAMYHDQGLGPLKTVGFEEGVNVTLGLPIVRVSVDHGTAFDLAGKGLASAASMKAAIRLARDIADNRRRSATVENGDINLHGVIL